MRSAEPAREFSARQREALLAVALRSIERGLRDGRVEVWANGERMAVASGPIGNDHATRYANDHSPPPDDEPPEQYFKFGFYADVCSVREGELLRHNVSICRVGETTVHVDQFRRGKNRAAVDPSLVD